MKVVSFAAVVSAVLVAASAGPAAAEGDAYCDYVEGVAAAESALLLSPELFGTFGYIDQPVGSAPEATSNDLRVTAGVQVRLGSMYQGLLTRRRAKADCRRSRALDQVDAGTLRRALDAQAKVLDAALPRAKKILAQADADLRARRASAAEVTATRVRVDALRELATRTRAELEALPAASSGNAGAALGAYHHADAEVEDAEASLRRAEAWQLDLRVGYDQFLDEQDDSPYFAMVSVGFNIGWLFQGGANQRAASARRRMVREQHAAGRANATTARLRAMLEVETRRAEETAALAGDLEQQVEQLRQIGGDAARRFRDTVWFEWVQAKAEHEYYAAHVAGLREVLGEEAAP